METNNFVVSFRPKSEDVQVVKCIRSLTEAVKYLEEAFSSLRPRDYSKTVEDISDEMNNVKKIIAYLVEDISDVNNEVFVEERP